MATGDYTHHSWKHDSFPTWAVSDPYDYNRMFVIAENGKVYTLTDQFTSPNKRRINMFRKLFAVLLLVLMFALPVSAQDTTPEPETSAPSIVIVDPSDTFAGLSATEVVLIVVLVVVLVGAGIGLNVLLKHNVELGRDLSNALPEWAWDALQSGAMRGLLELEELAESTPNTVDDELVARFREQLNEFFEEMRREIPVIVEQSLPKTARLTASQSTPPTTTSAG